MEIRRGDLLALGRAGVFDVLVHGCNCQGTMGAGIAKQIREQFPAAWAADRATPRGPAKLGTISTATVACGAHRLTIVNGYTQNHWRGRGVLVDYAALTLVMATVRERFGALRIGYPRIGAGLGRGDWPTIAALIDRELAGCRHWLVLPDPISP